MFPRLLIRCIAVAAACFLVAGCASPMARMTQAMPAAMMNLDDPQLAAEALPTQIVLLESMLQQSPDDPDLLSAAAMLYSVYARMQSADPARAQRLIGRAMRFAERALDRRHPGLGGVDLLPYARFEAAVAAMTRDDLPLWFGYASVRADWIRLNPDDPDAPVDIPRVVAIMRRVVALDEPYRDGAAHLYLGVLNAAMPDEFGGDLAAARAHFERLQQLTGGRDLMATYMYATVYADAADDAELKQRLLRQIIAADPEQPGLVLSNVMAQQRAAAALNK